MAPTGGENKRGERPASSGGANIAPRRPRSDAVANRARILAAAAEAFDHDGPSVPLDEIARRAGVGPGTLHRHFPTKAALIDATLADRIGDLAASIEALAAATDEPPGPDDPGRTLVAALDLLVDQGMAGHALADRLRSGGGDIDAAVAEPAARVRRTLARLLRRAQDAGAARRDLRPGDLDALVAAAHVAATHPAGGRRLVGVLWAALRPSPGQPAGPPD